MVLMFESRTLWVRNLCVRKWAKMQQKKMHFQKPWWGKS